MKIVSTNKFNRFLCSLSRKNVNSYSYVLFLLTCISFILGNMSISRFRKDKRERQEYNTLHCSLSLYINSVYIFNFL